MKRSMVLAKSFRTPDSLNWCSMSSPSGLLQRRAPGSAIRCACGKPRSLGLPANKTRRGRRRGPPVANHGLHGPNDLLPHLAEHHVAAHGHVRSEEGVAVPLTFLESPEAG